MIRARAPAALLILAVLLNGLSSPANADSTGTWSSFVYASAARWAHGEFTLGQMGPDSASPTVKIFNDSVDNGLYGAIFNVIGKNGYPQTISARLTSGVGTVSPACPATDPVTSVTCSSQSVTVPAGADHWPAHHEKHW